MKHFTPNTGPSLWTAEQERCQQMSAAICTHTPGTPSSSLILSGATGVTQLLYPEGAHICVDSF